MADDLYSDRMGNHLGGYMTTGKDGAEYVDGHLESQDENYDGGAWPTPPDYGERRLPAASEQVKTVAMQRRPDDRALVPDYESIVKVAQGLAKSCMFPEIKTEWEALAVIEYGRELGFPPVVSLQTIVPVMGRLCIKAQNLLAMMEDAGYKIELLEFTDKVNRMSIEGHGKPPKEFVFTWEEASKIQQYSKKNGKWFQIITKHNWLSFPKAMLLWRNTGQMQRAYAPGVGLGLIPKEELIDGTVFDELEEEEETGRKQLRVSPKKAETPKPEPKPEIKPEPTPAPKKEEPKPESKKKTAKKTEEKPAEPAAKPPKESPPPTKEESPAEQQTDEERIESFREYIHNDFNIRFGPEKWRKQYQHFKMFLLDFQKEKGRKWVGINEFQRLTFSLGDPDDLQVIRDNISWTLGRWRLWEKQKEEELEVLEVNAGAADAGE